MLFVLDRDFKMLCPVSNDSENTLHFYNDKLHTDLASGVSTFEFTVDKSHKKSKHIQEGNFVTILNKKGKQLLFTIIEVDEENSEKTVYCEDVGLDLLNETKPPSKHIVPKPISAYIEEAISDSGWEIGVNEIPNLNRTLEFTSFTNALERILNICTSFDNAEIEFTVEFNGKFITKQLINIYKKRGKETGIRLNAGKNLVGARKTVSMENLATSLYGVGAEIPQEDENVSKQYVDFKSIVYDDGRFYQYDGYLFDRESNKKWSRYRNQSETKGYIVDYYSFDTDSPQELFNRTLEQLKKRSEPAVTYEVDIAEIDESLDIGDTITVVDPDFNPPLFLSARVLEIDESETNISSNKVKLGNYVLVKPTVDIQLTEMQRALIEMRKTWTAQNQALLTVESTNGEMFFDGSISTNLSANVFRGGINITQSYNNSDFNWTKTDKFGALVSGWSKTGPIIPITNVDLLDKSIFICNVLGMENKITIFNVSTTIKASVAPSNPQQGQQWIDTSVVPPRLNIYLSGQWEKVEGELGPQGLPGTPAPTMYQWNMYADDEDGNGISELSDGKRYLGIAYNKSTSLPSNNPADYVWTPLFDNVIVGGANLVPNSTDVTSTEFLVKDYTLTKDIIAGQVYTVSINGTLNEGQQFEVRQNAGTNSKGFLTQQSDGIYTLTFTADSTTIGNEKNLRVYNYPELTATLAFIGTIQVETGNIRTDWRPATEDITNVIMGIESRTAKTESAVEPDAITNTVMGTVSFTAKLAEYAEASTLSNYTTTEAAEGIKKTAEAAKKAIDDLDLTPFVKVTQLQQLEDSITGKISQSGGVNLLRNSIGWSGSDLWTPTSEIYLIQAIQNPELENMGFGAGWYSPIGTYTHHTQEITLPMLGTYTLSFYMKKSAYDGTYEFKHAGVDVISDGETALVGLNGTTEAAELTNGFELFTYTFTARTSRDIVIRLNITNSSETAISGLMLNLGSEALQWSSHSTEVYNTNVRMDLNGLQVMGNRSGKRTVITTEEFAGYENDEKVFWVSGRTTKVKELEAEERFTMAPISIVTVDNETYKGWAFI